MAHGIPEFPTFDIHQDGSLARHWDKYIRRLDNLFVAMDANDAKKKRALLLRYVGEEVYDIFDTLENTGDDYTTAVQALTGYFEPKKKMAYAVYNFRQAKQNPGEGINSFVTRLRQLAIVCDFGENKDKEIKQQIIQSCTSQRLRRKALRNDDITLDQIISDARAMEQSEIEAKDMEGDASVNAVRSKHGKYSKHNNKHPNVDTKKCYACGGTYPHPEDKPCPAKGRACSYCKRLNHFAKCCRQQKRDKTSRKKGVNQVAEASAPNPEQDSNSSDDQYTFNVKEKFDQLPRVRVKINDVSHSVLIDSGSSVNAVSPAIAESLGVKLQRASNKLYAYASRTPLHIAGQFNASVESKHRITLAKFIVVPDANIPLLSYETSCELGLLHITNHITTAKDKLKQQYKGVFTGLGKLKDCEIKLHINKDIQPINQSHRRIPFHRRQVVEECVAKMQAEDIIEPASGPTHWINPIVLVPKSNGSTRLCIDMREANVAIERERHITPTLDDIVHKLNGAKVFSKLDMNSGYNQLMLHPESREISTFSTHMGLFRFKRLFFGVNAAAEKFNETVRSLLADIPNQVNISDDIFLFGSNVAEHDKALHAVLSRLQEKNLTVNASKCEFYQSSISFYGMRFSAEGISPDPKKVEAIHMASAPENVSQCQSLLGMTNYVSRFIPNYSTLTAPIRELIKKDSIFEWGERQEEALERLKESLTADAVMTYFDPNKPTELHVDASPFGVAGILMQGRKVVAYGSKSLTETEKRYSQIEREAYAIAWGCHHFRLFLLGKSFVVFTDHKPLLGLFNNPRSKPTPRIENWIIKLQSYNFCVEYQKGVNNPADYMSRHVNVLSDQSCVVCSSAEQHINLVLQSAKPNALSLDEIAIATENDSTLQCVLSFLSHSKWDLTKLSHPDGDLGDLKIMAMVKDEFSSVNGRIVLRNNQIVIPDSLQERVIELAHEGHQGQVKTKRLLRSKVWFTKLDKKCEKAVKECLLCQAATPSNVREPLKMTQLPSGPWQEISIDFCHVGDEYALVIIDDYSRYPIVELVSSTSSKAVIPKLDSVFSIFGVPKIVKSDNGPPFNSERFASFAKHLGFKHRKITPLWPEANGEVERFMRTFKKVLHTTKYWKEEMFGFLRNYRATPHCTTGYAPATALFGREINIKLPTFDSKLPAKASFDHQKMRDSDCESKNKIKSAAESRRNIKESEIQIGDTVLVKQQKENKFTTPFSSQPMTVTHKNNSMITASSMDKRMTRNSSHFKKVNLPSRFQSDPQPIDLELDEPSNEPEIVTIKGDDIRRSSRIRKAPNRLIETA